MRACAAMFAAACGYVLLIGTLLGLTTASARPTIELSAELGEPTVLAVETGPSLVAGCERTPIS